MSDEREQPEATEETAPEEAGAAGGTVDVASDEPAVDESTVDESTVDEPAVDEPAVDDPTTDDPTADESTAEDTSTDDPTTDETSPLPPTAGVRADRRVRTGVSLGWGIWLVAFCAVLSAAAVGALYARAPSPGATDLPELMPPQESGAARISFVAEQQLREARQQLERLCAALATEIVTEIVASVPAPAPAPSPAAAPAVAPAEGAASSQPASQPAATVEAVSPPAVTVDATSLTRLRQRIEELRKEYPGLRGAVLDPEGKLAHAVGGPAPGEPALSELLDAMRAGTPLPGSLVGASSVAKQGVPRVVLVVPAPQLPAEELHAARLAEERARGQQARLVEVARDGVAQRDQLARLNLQLFAVAGVGALLVILALLFGVVGPLRRSLTEFARRASERASGREPAAAGPLPRELATADELLATAFAVARVEQDQASAHAALSLELDELIDLCERASGGDLSARATEGKGDRGALARSLNLLVDSFERRALRLRSHAKAPASTLAHEAAAGELRQRALSLNAMVQLLADIAARLRGFAERLQEGEDVESELSRLGEAVEVRTRTARAYLTALHKAIDSVMEEQPSSPDAKLSLQIEAELADLKLDISFPAQVGALQDLGPDEIRRRLEAEVAEPADEQDVAGAE